MLTVACVKDHEAKIGQPKYYFPLCFVVMLANALKANFGS